MEDYLEKYKQEIVAMIEEVLADHFRQHASEILFVDKIHEYLLQYATRGKCVRGLNVIAFQFGNTLSQDALRAAAAMELFHSGLLVHDDIMDIDDMRRGLPSVHRFYQTLDARLSDHDAYALAMCIGDVLFFLAYELLGQISEHAGEVARIMSQEMMRVGYAQQKDVYFGLQDTVTEDEIIRMYEDKTAGYTFSLPFSLGNILSGGHYDDEQLEVLGKKLGIVFQIIDDCLEIFGTSEEIGKSVMSDVSNGKKTLYMMLLHAKANADDQAFIEMLLESKDVSNGRFEKLQKMLDVYEVKPTITTYIEAYKQDILEDIAIICEPGSELEKYMKFLVYYIIDRRV